MITFMRRYRRGLQVGLLRRDRRLRGLAVRVRLERLRHRAPSADTVATVNGETISRRQYQDRYQGYLEMYSQRQPGPAHGRSWPSSSACPSGSWTSWSPRRRSCTAREARGAGPQRRGVQRRRARDARVPGQRALLDGAVPALPPGPRRRGRAASSGASSPCARCSGSSWAACASPTPRSSRRGACAARRCARRGRWSSWRRWSTAATASDDEVAEYLKTHGEEFKLPERRKVQYVTLAAEGLRAAS